MNTILMLKLEIFDRNGKVLKTIRKESESWCRAYAAIMLAQMRGSHTASPTAPDTGNTNRTLRNYTNPFQCDGGLGITTFGVRVGTNSQAVDMADYAMVAAIAEGTGSGQMEHQATAISSPSTAGNVSSFTIIRTIVNNSGSSITVEECGVYGKSQDNMNNVRYFLLCRDVTGAQVIPDGGGITVTYTVSTTVG